VSRAVVSFFLLGLLSSFPLLNAGEFALINEEIAFTDSSSGFHFWNHPGQGPTNWVSPDNYYDGQIYCRFEVLAQPTASPSYLSFCIWSKPEQPGTSPETATPLSAALRGAGSVATFSSVPATWWRQYGGVNFTNRNSIYRWGIPHWISSSPHIPLAPQGYSDDPRSGPFWAQRTNWLPFRVKVTVAAVSQGSLFSGWTNYVRATPDTNLGRH
jgi:hypothetical protein